MEEINGKVTLRDVYDAIDTTKKELRQEIGFNRNDIKELSAQFGALEAGRLSAAEKNIAELRADIRVIGKEVTDNTVGRKKFIDRLVDNAGGILSAVIIAYLIWKIGI